MCLCRVESTCTAVLFGLLCLIASVQLLLILFISASLSFSLSINPSVRPSVCPSLSQRQTSVLPSVRLYLNRHLYLARSLALPLDLIFPATLQAGRDGRGRWAAGDST